MGNLFSFEEEEQRTYSLKDIPTLKQDLGKMYYKGTEDSLNSEFSDLYYNPDNITNISELNKLGKYFQDIESNLISNYGNDNWLEKQLGTELLDNNVLKVNFNSVLPINYDEFSNILDLVKNHNKKDVNEDNEDNENKNDGNDNNENNDLNENPKDDIKEEDEEYDDRRIVELYTGTSCHIFNNTITGKPSYGKVNVSNTKLGLRNGDLVLYSEYDDSFGLSNSLSVEWYFMVLNDGSKYVVFDNYYFNGSENDNLLEYDNQLLKLLTNASESLSNNNLREVKSYVSKFNRYLETLEKVDNNEIVVMLGDTTEGNLLNLEYFVENFNIEI